MVSFPHQMLPLLFVLWAMGSVVLPVGAFQANEAVGDCNSEMHIHSESASFREKGILVFDNFLSDEQLQQLLSMYPEFTCCMRQKFHIDVPLSVEQQIKKAMWASNNSLSWNEAMAEVLTAKTMLGTMKGNTLTPASVAWGPELPHQDKSQMSGGEPHRDVSAVLWLTGGDGTLQFQSLTGGYTEPVDVTVMPNRIVLWNNLHHKHALLATEGSQRRMLGPLGFGRVLADPLVPTGSPTTAAATTTTTLMGGGGCPSCTRCAAPGQKCTKVHECDSTCHWCVDISYLDASARGKGYLSDWAECRKLNNIEFQDIIGKAAETGAYPWMHTSIMFPFGFAFGLLSLIVGSLAWHRHAHTSVPSALLLADDSAATADVDLVSIE